MRKLTLVLAAGLLVFGVAQAQYPMVNSIPGTFIDISGTGTPLNPGDDSSTLITTSVGNPLLPAGSVYVCSNGHLGLSSYTGYSNVAIPGTTFYGGGTGLAPFWDDLNGNSGGNAYWQQIGDTLVIEWYNIPHYSNTGAATFEVQIFNPGTGPGYAQFLYQDVVFGDVSLDNGASATVGYQTNSTTGVQWSFNQAVITDGLVLTIVPEPATLLLLAAGLLLRRR
jgi:hypothetical protein